MAAAFEVATQGELTTPLGAISPLLLTFAIVEAQYHQDLVGGLLGGLQAVASQDALRSNAWFRTVFSRPPQVARFLNRVVLCADVAPLDTADRRGARLLRSQPSLPPPRRPTSPTVRRSGCSTSEEHPSPFGCVDV